MRREDWDSPSRILAAWFDGEEPRSAVKGPTKYTIVCDQHFDESDFPQWTYDGNVV